MFEQTKEEATVIELGLLVEEIKQYYDNAAKAMGRSQFENAALDLWRAVGQLNVVVLATEVIARQLKKDAE